MPETLHRIFTAMLVMGVPGSGKTSCIGTYADYVFETYKKVTCLYSWDGGAVPTDVLKRVRQGILRFWRVRTRSSSGLGIENLYYATRGYWPRSINVETGETSPAVDLIAPITTVYTISCPKSHPLAKLPTRLQFSPTYCSECKVLYAVGDLRIAEDAYRSKGFEAVGAVAFDGLTSMGNVVLEHMDHARGQGQIGGEKPAFGGIVQSGSIKLGGNNRADIGFGQTRVLQFVNNSLSIPHLVVAPLFTALTMEGSDEGGLSIVGPKLPGRAATDEAPAWFGDVCELGKEADDAGRERFVIYLRPFTDAQNRRHLLKTSASPTGVPDKLTDPIGQPWTQVNLGLVCKMLDEDLVRALAEASPVGAPGLAGTPTEYGEGFAMLPAAGPAPAATDLPPLMPAAGASTPVPSAPTAAASVGAGAAAAPPTVRRRPRPETPTDPTTMTPTTMTPTTTTTEPAPVEARVGPPPPPGRPPQRAPGAP